MVLHYRMCLSGGKDVHNALLSSLKDLARLFSSYSDEVLVRISFLFYQFSVLNHVLMYNYFLIVEPLRSTSTYELFDR